MLGSHTLRAAPRPLPALAAALALSLSFPTGAGAERLMSIYDAGAKSSVSLFVGVPVFLNVDRDVVRPGFSMDGRYGIDFGYVSVEIETGFQATPIDASGIADAPFDREPLHRVYAGLGLRLQIPNDTRVLPYVSATFDFAWWQLYQVQIEVGHGVIYGRRAFDFAPGIGARGGIAIRARGDLYVDLALRFGTSFPGGFFDVQRYWLTPTVGLTYRR